MRALRAILTLVVLAASCEDGRPATRARLPEPGQAGDGAAVTARLKGAALEKRGKADRVAPEAPARSADAESEATVSLRDEPW